MTGRSGTSRKRSISTADMPARTSPRKKGRSTTPSSSSAEKATRLSSKSPTKSLRKPRSSARIATKAESLSPQKQRSPPRTPQSKRLTRQPLTRSDTLDTLSNDSQSTSSVEPTRSSFSQLLKHGLSSDELVTHHQLLSLMLSSRSEPIIRKPTWKRTKKALESSITSATSSRQPVPAVIDTAALFEAVGEFPFSNSRQEELIPGIPRILDLQRHARRHYRFTPHPVSTKYSVPSSLSLFRRRKQRMNAVFFDDTVPISPHWSLCRMEGVNSSSLNRSSSLALPDMQFGESNMSNSCAHPVVATEDSRQRIQNSPQLRWWEGIKSYFSALGFTSSRSKAK
ncbi:hypothetical protein QCA50_009767 [Cerrena zonata]|uniref:Uncharacterized protein n=1 Tax=Cerrena zonata TaxID=2478898 RepID=A0AAW0G4E8_9APHY